MTPEHWHMKYGGLSFFYTSTCLSMISSGLAHFGEPGTHKFRADGEVFISQCKTNSLKGCIPNSSSICVQGFHWSVSAFVPLQKTIDHFWSYAICIRCTLCCFDKVKLSRLLADPAFLYKLTLEQGFTIGYGIWWECQHRGNR